jgi:hypothetical protein
MKLAIMQPYLFPYIGYFQLMNAVDKFVIYDDVKYINRGWINRNCIKLNNSSFLFTIPLKNVSQNICIRDLKLALSKNWKNKFFKSIEHAYKKAPYFDDIYMYIEQVINMKSQFIKDLHLESFYLINNYLNIETSIIESSSIYMNQHLNGQKRIMDICVKENANHYINPIGGVDLYDTTYFTKQQITIDFLKTNSTISYNQQNNNFISNLSIIDLLMNLPQSKICELLTEYEIVQK